MSYAKNMKAWARDALPFNASKAPVRKSKKDQLRKIVREKKDAEILADLRVGMSAPAVALKHGVAEYRVYALRAELTG